MSQLQLIDRDLDEFELGGTITWPLGCRVPSVWQQRQLFIVLKQSIMVTKLVWKRQLVSAVEQLQR